MTRPAITHTFTLDGQQCYFNVGLNDLGQPIELFVTMQKVGSTAHGFCNAFGRLFSTALQAEVPLSTLIRRMKGVSFAPCGLVTHTDSKIKEADSVIDYIAQWLEQRFSL